MHENPNPQTKPPLWDSPCGKAGKFALLVALVASFVTQTYLVYSDPLVGEALSPAAQDGRRIWYANNCQSCHQLYGFGGFLGPDLTNAAPGLTPDRLNTVLTEGSGTMPAFQMTPEDIQAVAAFLDAMDRTGRGQARALYGEGDPSQLLASFEKEVGARLAAAGPSPAATGFDLVVARSCHTCHIPFRRYSNGAADMSRVTGRLTDDRILHVLLNGKGTAMPKPAPEMTEAERTDVLAYLKWLGTNRQQLLDALDMSDAGKIKWADVPWWDFQ
jgi:nitric oxide reductase subunit C